MTEDEIITKYAKAELHNAPAIIQKYVHNLEAKREATGAVNRSYAARNDALEYLAMLALGALEEAQGEWATVAETYAPEWTHPLKREADALKEAIDKTE